GFGTFEEICEMVTWSQLGIHTKPCGLLNVDGYYDPLLQLFDQAVDEGFLLPAYRRLIVAAETPEVLLDRLSEPLLPSPMARLARENA
ncbi:MAG: LOG family protein, partial [Burkholderiales bacterium]|nr:LOG family protein [Burkholderiales bacterium]